MESIRPDFFRASLGNYFSDPKVDFAHCFGMFFCAAGFKSVVQHRWFFSSGVVSLVIHPVVLFVLGKRQVGNMIVDLWSTY